MRENEDLTVFERAVLDKLLAGDHLALEVLQAQAQALHVTEREWHGTAGFATDLEVDPTAPWFGQYINFHISDVLATISGMQIASVYVVFVRAGRLVQLEGTAFGDEPWPNPILDFELRYVTEPRELDYRLRISATATSLRRGKSCMTLRHPIGTSTVQPSVETGGGRCTRSPHPTTHAVADLAASGP